MIQNSIGLLPKLIVFVEYFCPILVTRRKENFAKYKKNLPYFYTYQKRFFIGRFIMKIGLGTCQPFFHILKDWITVMYRSKYYIITAMRMKSTFINDTK